MDDEREAWWMISSSNGPEPEIEQPMLRDVLTAAGARRAVARGGGGLESESESLSHSRLGARCWWRC